MKSSGRILGLFLVLSLPAWASAGQLTFEERLAYQEKVEKVYYRHRMGRKLSFEEVLPQAELEKKVRKSLLQNAVVEEVGKRCGYRLDRARLQAELERICRSTKAPDTLRELFAALDNNAYLAREVLVRPILAEKMSRTLYQGDTEFHRAAREKAETVRDLLSAGGDWSAFGEDEGVEYGKIHLTASSPLRSERGEGSKMAVSPAPSSRSEGKGIGPEVEVEPEELAARYASRKDGGRKGILRETKEGFVIERLVGTGEGDHLIASRNVGDEASAPQALDIESLIVRKRPYEAWLEERVKGLGLESLLVSSDGVLYSSLPNSQTLDSHIPIEPLPPIPATASSCTPDSWQAPYAGAATPTAREYHTAVWTGTEMIVWGGYPTTATGGRYDPATDSWTTTTTAGAPTGRSRHTAVWTGTQMIVWGGYDGGYYFNTGGIYTPDCSPPGECSGPGETPLRFTSATQMTWETDPVASGYNLYRGDLSLLPNYGDCYQSNLSAASYVETQSPPAGTGWLYLVSARNANGEGTLGTDSAGTERFPNTACP